MYTVFLLDIYSTSIFQKYRKWSNSEALVFASLSANANRNKLHSLEEVSCIGSKPKLHTCIQLYIHVYAGSILPELAILAFEVSIIVLALT